MRTLKKLKKVFCGLFLAGGLCLEARATEVSHFSMGLGYPSMTVSLDPRLQPDLRATVAISPELWRTLRDLPLAVGVMSQIFWGGDFGQMPVMQAGVSLRYFPFGRPTFQYAIADDVVVSSSAWKPYLKLVPGVEFDNLRNASVGAQFGSSSWMYIVSLGVLAPGSNTGHWSVEVSYSSTLGATDPNSSPIRISGFLVSAAYSLALP